MKKSVLSLFVFLAISIMLSSCQLSALTCAELDGSYVYSQEMPQVYLGFFGNQFASESIMNKFGTYGSSFSILSVRNEFGTYGSTYSLYSVHNDYTSTPPQIYRNGILIGYQVIWNLLLNSFPFGSFHQIMPQCSI